MIRITVQIVPFSSALGKHMRKYILLGLAVVLLVSCAAPQSRPQAPHYIDGSTPQLWNMPDGLSEFPIAQSRLKHTGFVELEYSVTTEGLPQNIAVIEPSDAAFVSAAIRVLQKARFAIPRTWSADDAQKNRILILVVFDVYGLPKVKTNPDIETIVVSINADVHR